MGGVGNFEDYTGGYFFWDNLDSAVIFQALAENCHLGHGLTVIKKHKEFVDTFYFVTDISNFKIKQFFLNNLDIIEKFMGIK